MTEEKLEIIENAQAVHAEYYTGGKGSISARNIEALDEQPFKARKNARSNVNRTSFKKSDDPEEEK